MTCLNCGARPVVGGPAFIVRAGTVWCEPCREAAQADAAARRAAAQAALAAVRQPAGQQGRPTRGNASPFAPLWAPKPREVRA